MREFNPPLAGWEKIGVGLKTEEKKVRREGGDVRIPRFLQTRKEAI